MIKLYANENFPVDTVLICEIKMTTISLRTI